MEQRQSRAEQLENMLDISQDTSKDDKVEIVATLLGSFILGASFAKEFFTHGRFEIRIFLFGVSCFILFFAVSLVAKIWIQLFDYSKKVVSCFFFFFFFTGNFAALELFNNQFLKEPSRGDLRFETIIFLASYTISANLLYSINKSLLCQTLRKKTIYKYLLAPINGLSLGVIITGIIVWSTSHLNP